MLRHVRRVPFVVCQRSISSSLFRMNESKEGTEQSKNNEEVSVLKQQLEDMKKKYDEREIKVKELQVPLMFNEGRLFGKGC